MKNKEKRKEKSNAKKAEQKVVASVTPVVKATITPVVKSIVTPIVPPVLTPVVKLGSITTPLITYSFHYVENGKVKINNLSVMRYASRVMKIFRVKGKNPCRYVQIVGGIMFPIENESEFVCIFLKHVEETYPDDIINGVTREMVLHALVRGVETYFSPMKFNILEEIPAEYCKDKKDVIHFYFKNRFVKITATSITVHEYRELDRKIWNTQIIQRDIFYSGTSGMDSVFSKFFLNISGGNADRFECNATAIGYITHNNKDRAQCPAIVLMDEQIAEEGEANGGTGKGMFIMAVNAMTNCLYKDGQGFKFGKQFSFQDVSPLQQVIIYDDTSVYFPFQKLFGIITNVINVERKFRDVVTLPFNQIPKILISTNYVLLAPNGSSTERRKVEIEFAPYYTLERTPAIEFGHRLFDEWDSVEWNKFHSFIFDCCQLYLQKGLKQYPSINRDRKKMEVRVSKALMEYIDFELSKAKPGVFSFNKKTHMKYFLKDFPYMREAIRTQHSFTKRVREYLTELGYDLTESPKDTKVNLVFEIKPSEDKKTLAA